MHLNPGLYTFLFTFVNGTKRDTESSMFNVHVGGGMCGREHMYQLYRLPRAVRIEIRDRLRENPNIRAVRVSALPSWSVDREPQRLTVVYRNDALPAEQNFGE